ncbi:MAG: hypothetical protein CSB49_06885 [Proteobacteria bacterium]|nr:MAG: hypothetical protein CSB49_06885 [Pseudomonadota bacterium]
MSIEEPPGLEETLRRESIDLSQEPEDPLLGKVVANRYRVLAKMGEGGMGTVYLAEHVTIEKKVALKVLLHEYARKPDLKQRFLQEAKAAASINHENIIDITDFGETPDKSVFFAMEFLEGADLSHAIKRGPLPWSRAKPILLQICRSLGAAHSKDIIHRDMKPENVFLVEREGRPDFVKVLDFGIAKVSGATDGDHKLTRTGMVFGTPEYMSPEQAQGHQPDHRVDIYAVGVIMYELLTGEVPFKADTFMGILTKHIFEDPVPPTQRSPELQIPVDAEAVILKAMAKDRDERFGSMSEMGAAIKAVSGRMTRSTADHMPTPVISSADKGAGAMAPRPDVRTVNAAPDKSARVVQPVKSVAPGDVALPSSRGKAITIVVALLVLLGGGVAIAVALSDDDRPKPKVRVVMTLTSEPAGATVYSGTVEGKLIGTTPVSFETEKDTSRRLFTFVLEGYGSERRFGIPDKNGKHVMAKLKKLEPVAKPKPKADAGEPTPDAGTDKPGKVAGIKKPKAKASSRRIRWPKPEPEPKTIKPKTKPEPKPKPKSKPSPATPTKVDRQDLKNPFSK